MRMEKLKTLGFYVVGIVGAYGIYALLVHQMVTVTAPAPVNQARVAERQKAWLRFGLLRSRSSIALALWMPPKAFIGSRSSTPWR
jgi:hypothetical protein